MRRVDTFDKTFNEMVVNGYISVQQHPTADLYIYNYTHKCQFDKMWNEWTMMCRGLILDAYGHVVSSPFKKFFNIEELDQLPAEEFEVFEKYDGSLGITYWLDDKPYIATRGSFTSEQALVATELLHQIFDTDRLSFSPKYTYLFEIIYPENRIVVDYGKDEKLVLLAVIDTDTGEEVPLDTVPIKVEKAIQSVKSLDELKQDRPNSEGFVIRFKSGLRCKVKHAEYVRLHKLITGVNERRIWEILMSDGQDGIKVFLDRVPDEFYEWVRGIVKRLLDDYIAFETKADQKLWYCEKLPNRKEQALWLTGETFIMRAVVFAMLDNKPYKQIIWKHLKPSASRPFKLEVE